MKHRIEKVVFFPVIILIVIGLSNVNAAEKKKVMFIDSYHVGFKWSDGVTRGILGALNMKMNDDGSVDDSNSTVKLKIVKMDTKRNKSKEFIEQAAKKAKEEIDAWKPDVVIASEDNAAKYLIVPYLKDKELPVVFCGVNWDASGYGFPAENVTGMVEVALIKPLLNAMKKYAKGGRIGYLAQENTTNKKYEKHFGEKKLNVATKYVNSVDEWKQGFVDFQNEADMILLSSFAFKDWDKDGAAKTFIENNIKIPTGAYDAPTSHYALIGYAKVSEEQGEWSGKTALDIIAGKSPADIPVVTNKKAKIYLNLPLADKLGIKFPLRMINVATIIK